MASLADLFASSQAPNVNQLPMRATPFQRPRGLKSGVGSVLDALAIMGGAAPSYRQGIDAQENKYNQSMKEQQFQNVFRNFVENPDDPLIQANLAEVNPEAFTKVAPQNRLTPQGGVVRMGAFGTPEMVVEAPVKPVAPPRLNTGFPGLIEARARYADGSPEANLLDQRIAAEVQQKQRLAAGPAPRAATSGGGTTPAGKPPVAVKPDVVRDRSFFAKVYTPWVVEGGRAEVDRRVEQLKQVRQMLLQNPSITGGPSGYLPDKARSLVNRQGLTAQQLFEEVVQSNLRQVLGGQFAMKEGEGVLARAFDPKASAKDNATRLGRLLTQIEEAKAAKDAAAQYFEENQTVGGFKGMNRPAPAASTAPTATGPDGQKIMWNGTAWVPAR